MLLTLFGITTDVIEAQPSKAFSPISVTLLEMTILWALLLLNAPGAILCGPSGT